MNDTLKLLLAEIEETRKKISFGKEPVNLYDPIYYLMDLGGKRIRPLLSVLSYRLFKEDYRKILLPSLALEVFHNFTLMHDDIMDKAPIRRGRETVHKKWNDNIAILSGDVMLVRAYDLLLEVNGDKLKEVVKRFNNCAAEVCEGQQLDMDFESADVIDEQAYLEMIRLKTAVLLGFSLELGALMAGSTYDDQHLLREFGIDIGMGFQLMDDLLDVYADQNKFGKQVGGDIIANKKTYLLIKAMQNGTGKDVEELKFWLQAKKFDNNEKVVAVKGIYDRLYIDKVTQEKINDYFNRGFNALEKVSVSNDKKTDLIELTNYLKNREA